MATKRGPHGMPIGEDHHSAVLSERKVKWARRMHERRGLCIRCLATYLDVSYPAVWDAVNYNTWKHVRE